VLCSTFWEFSISFQKSGSAALFSSSSISSFSLAMSKRSPHFLYIFAQALDFQFELFQFEHPYQLPRLFFIIILLDRLWQCNYYYNRKQAVVKVFLRTVLTFLALDDSSYQLSRPVYCSNSAVHYYKRCINIKGRK